MPGTRETSLLWRLIERLSSKKGVCDFPVHDSGGSTVRSARALTERCVALRKSLKVIYVTGYTRDSLVSQQTFEDGTEFIEKPFTREGVLARIAEVLNPA